jgi:hypothetical protein
MLTEIWHNYIMMMCILMLSLAGADGFDSAQVYGNVEDPVIVTFGACSLLCIRISF